MTALIVAASSFAYVTIATYLAGRFRAAHPIDYGSMGALWPVFGLAFGIRRVYLAVERSVVLVFRPVFRFGARPRIPRAVARELGE